MVSSPDLSSSALPGLSTADDISRHNINNLTPPPHHFNSHHHHKMSSTLVNISSKEQFSSLLSSSRILVADCKHNSPTYLPRRNDRRY